MATQPRRHVAITINKERVRICAPQYEQNRSAFVICIPGACQDAPAQDPALHGAVSCAPPPASPAPHPPSQWPCAVAACA
eukprot:360299-Chlamydomonas_euryale.AAC.7